MSRYVLPSTIRFTFDNDALQRLACDPDYGNLKDMILKSVERRCSELCLSFVNLFELAKGIAPDNFDRLQTIVHAALELTLDNDGSVLLSPPDHILVSLRRLDPAFVVFRRKQIAANFRAFVRSSDYKQLEHDSGVNTVELKNICDCLTQELRQAHRKLEDRAI